MIPSRPIVSLALTSFLCGAAQAQLPVPEIHSLQPPVVKAGASTEVTLTGSNLEESTGLTFSLPGITGKPVLLPASPYRKNPGQDGLKFTVTVPADIPPQTVEVRSSGWHGISTSRPLVVIPSSRPILQDSAGAAHHKPESAPELPREAVAWGTMDARQTDWWKFSAKKGERLIVVCRAEQIDSMADATLRVIDSRGRELSSNRDSSGRDPVLDFTAPADGDYYAGVHDVFFNGGSQYYYLLEITGKPWIDAVFPPAGPPGKSFSATLIGRNLPGGSQGENLSIGRQPVETVVVSIQAPAQPAAFFNPAPPASALLDSFPFQWNGSNTVPVGFSDFPVVTVPEDNDSLPAAEVPVEFVSRFEQRYDTDYFRFRAAKGTEYVIEVIGDRIAGLIDPFLFVDRVQKSGDGAETFARVKETDDEGNPTASTFRDGTRDAVIAFQADQDGEFRIGILDQFAGAGPEKIYRLIVRPAQPDFSALAVCERDFLDQRQAFPAMPHLRKGGSYSARILIKRKDGWNKPITISAEGLPEGVTCSPVTFVGKETSGRIVFTALPEAKNWAGSIRLWASSPSGETEWRRPVRLGALTWSAADYNLSRLRPRLNLDIPLSVQTRDPSPATIAVTSREFSVEIGKKLEIPLSVTKHEPKGPLAVTIAGLQGLQKPPSINLDEKTGEGTLTLDVSPQNGVFTPEPGKWNFLIQASGVTKYRNGIPALERAETELKELTALAQKSSAEAAQAKTEIEEKKKNIAELEKNLAAAAAESRPEVEKFLAEARALHETALKRSSEAEAAKIAIEKERDAADKRFQAAKTASAPKDLKFVAWSEPLTVEIKPAPAAAAK